MWNEEVERVVQGLAGEVMQEVKEWRLDNPKATSKEIEAAVDRSWRRPSAARCKPSLAPDGCRAIRITKTSPTVQRTKMTHTPEQGRQTTAVG